MLKQAKRKEPRMQVVGSPKQNQKGTSRTRAQKPLMFRSKGEMGVPFHPNTGER